MELDCMCAHCRLDRQKANKAIRDERIAQEAAEEAEKEKVRAKASEAARVKYIEQVKAAKMHQYLSRGGIAAGFEREWPQILRDYQLGKDDGFGPQNVVDEIVARKRASGLYGNLA